MRPLVAITAGMLLITSITTITIILLYYTHLSHFGISSIAESIKSDIDNPLYEMKDDTAILLWVIGGILVVGVASAGVWIRYGVLISKRHQEALCLICGFPRIGKLEEHIGCPECGAHDQPMIQESFKSVLAHSMTTGGVVLLLFLITNYPAIMLSQGRIGRGWLPASAYFDDHLYVDTGCESYSWSYNYGPRGACGTAALTLEHSVILEKDGQSSSTTEARAAHYNNVSIFFCLGWPRRFRSTMSSTTAAYFASSVR